MTVEGQEHLGIPLSGVCEEDPEMILGRKMEWEWLNGRATLRQVDRNTPWWEIPGDTRRIIVGALRWIEGKLLGN